MAAEVGTVRRILGQHFGVIPFQAALNDSGGISASDLSFTVDSGQGAYFKKGQWWEFQDGTGNNAEIVLVDSISTDTVTVPTGGRAFLGTTAATHADDMTLWLEPWPTYNITAEAINKVLDSDLFSRDVYEIVEHQVTSSTTTNAYDAPSSSCERILDIYQRAASTDVPQRRVLSWTQYRNADTTLWSTGKVFEVWGNYGVAGTAIYYVNCAHRLSITTITTAQARIAQAKAKAYVLQWSDSKRIQGPTNQADRSVKPLDATRLAGRFKAEYERLVRDEAAYLRRYTPVRREFLKDR